jgi:hypothetical protein
MSHHYSGPNFGFPHGDARLDLTDLYAFPKPGDGAKSILIMNVHPSNGFNPPDRTTAIPFASEAIYELKIDTNGDAGLKARMPRGRAMAGRSLSTGRRSRRGRKRGSRRPATIVSSPVGAAIPFSSTRWEP